MVDRRDRGGDLLMQQSRALRAFLSARAKRRAAGAGPRARRTDQPVQVDLLSWQPEAPARDRRP